MSYPSFAQVLFRGVAFAVAILLAACATSTTTVVKAGQRFSLYGPSTLHVRDQAEFKLRSARINADTLVGVLAHSSDRLKVPLVEVDRLVDSSRSRGAARGALWGAMYGMSLGGVYGLLNVDRSSLLANTPTSAAMVGMMGGVVYGLLAGGIVGAAVGHEQRYVFEPISPGTHEAPSDSGSGLREDRDQPAGTGLR